MSDIASVVAGVSSAAVRSAVGQDAIATQARKVQQIVADRAVAKGGVEVQADDLRAAAGQVQQTIETASGRQLRLSVDESSHRLYVEVRDKRTGEVIKQFPAEGVRKLQARLSEWIGLLFDEEA